MPVVRDGSGALFLCGIRLSTIARNVALGTPAYVYDLDGIAGAAKRVREAFSGAPHLVAYAVKANSAGPIVRALVREGVGADVVSGAELEVALGCGVSPEQILYSGVAKRDDELRLALSVGPRGIGAIQVESREELSRVAAVARSVQRVARVSLRMNPSVDVETLGTHAHIATGHDEAKFGIPKEDAANAIEQAQSFRELALVGITVHVGSQFTTLAPYLSAARVAFEIGSQAIGKGAPLEFVDTGGGFGIDYGNGCDVTPADFVRETCKLRRDLGRTELEKLALFIEPGRSLVAAHGVLLANVIQSKISAARRWTMIDAGMNDLIRPALYQARHRIVPLESSSSTMVRSRVVGPVCESSDDFGEHELPAEGMEHVAILDSGAYGFTMASSYNGRPLPAEVFIADGRIVATSPRGNVQDWIRDRVKIGEL